MFLVSFEKIKIMPLMSETKSENHLSYFRDLIVFNIWQVGLMLLTERGYSSRNEAIL